MNFMVISIMAAFIVTVAAGFAWFAIAKNRRAVAGVDPEAYEGNEPATSPAARVPRGAETREQIQHVVESVAEIVTEMAGIQLGPKQYSMVENRLKTRMLKLEIPSFTEYLEFAHANTETESQALLSLMTTHHTYFFREFSHFEYLLNKGLNILIERARSRGDKKIRVWSAASSRGQEVYSLAMFFRFHLKAVAPDVDFEVWGTDIDPDSVAFAKNSVYKYEELKQVPAMYADGSWSRGTGNVSEFAKMKKELRDKCRFQTANLLDVKNFLNGKTFDVIFCRNVFIYFNQDQIKECTQNMLKHLDPAGFLFLGVSESLNGLGIKVDSLAPSVYGLKAPAVSREPGAAPSAARPSPTLLAARAMPATPPKPIRVLCVDDSPIILTLLKKILVQDQGFEVVATAANGLQAVELLGREKFDVITLDLHMPEMDGLGFLEKTKGSSRPPVVILSSVNRDDPSIGKRGLELGAFDYVEKPSLENLAQAGNEIRAKLKLALSANLPAVSPAPAPAPSAKSTSTPPAAKPGSSTPAASGKPSAAPAKTAVAAPAGGKKKVLIVDDSQTIRQLLNQIIKKDPELEVVAEAELPSQVEDLIKKHRPDVITLDIHMPEMDGVTLLKKIFPIYKIPTVMISSISREEGPQVLQALESGAVDYIQKPSLREISALSAEICERLKVAANAKVGVSSNSRGKIASRGAHSKEKVVVLGASTGGTEAIRKVLMRLPDEIPPILIVQHIPAGFSTAFANRLNQLCPFEVREAQDGDVVKPNRVLIAPGGKQMALIANGDQLTVRVNDDEPVNRHKPSVDYLFKSAADAELPIPPVAVIMTGMGADGARMMKRLRDKGSHTIAQDQASCVVYGMPREAAALGAAEFVKPLDEIADTIWKLVSEDSTKVSSKKVS